MLALIFIIAGFVLFVLAACAVPSGRFSLGWAGAACVTFALLIVPKL